MQWSIQRHAGATDEDSTSWVVNADGETLHAVQSRQPPLPDFFTTDTWLVMPTHASGGAPLAVTLLLCLGLCAQYVATSLAGQLWLPAEAFEHAVRLLGWDITIQEVAEEDELFAPVGVRGKVLLVRLDQALACSFIRANVLWDRISPTSGLLMQSTGGLRLPVAPVLQKTGAGTVHADPEVVNTIAQLAGVESMAVVVDAEADPYALCALRYLGGARSKDWAYVYAPTGYEQAAQTIITTARTKCWLHAQRIIPSETTTTNWPTHAPWVLIVVQAGSGLEAALRHRFFDHNEQQSLLFSVVGG